MTQEHEDRVTVVQTTDGSKLWQVCIDGRVMYDNLKKNEVPVYRKRAEDSLATNGVPISSMLVSAIANIWASIAPDAHVEDQTELIEACLPSLDVSHGAHGSARQELTKLIADYGYGDVIAALARHPHLQYV